MIAAMSNLLQPIMDQSLQPDKADLFDKWRHFFSSFFIPPP